MRGEAPDYLEQIKPLLMAKCVAATGRFAKKEISSRYRWFLLEGGVVVASEPEQSYLLDRITAEHADDRMPPESEGEPLTGEQIELLRRWIAAGLPAPEAEQPLPPPAEHWAYQPIARGEIPNADAPRRRHRDESNRPLSGGFPASRRGGPRRSRRRGDSAPPDHRGPDRTPSAAFGLGRVPGRRFARSVCPPRRSLARQPALGERWGRHWMDVWRYSDWDGYKKELRGSQRHIWHWRDWIIESLNEDKGYDQMILEMIAGDELQPDDPDTLRATGFLARNYHKSNRDIWLDATVEHTAKAFLGMTIACARCHDHKYDPISQQDYYAFRAIFEPHRVRADRLPGQPDLDQDGLPRAYDADPEAMTYLYVQGDEKRPDKENPLAPAVPAFFDRPLEITPVSLPLKAFFPAAAEHVEREDFAAAARRRRGGREGGGKARRDSYRRRCNDECGRFQFSPEPSADRSAAARGGPGGAAIACPPLGCRPWQTYRPAGRGAPAIGS